MPPSRYEIAFHIWIGVILIAAFVFVAALLAYYFMGSWSEAVAAVVGIAAFLFLPPLLIKHLMK